MPQLFVQSNPMRELGPRKRIRLLDIVQELDHLEGAGANLLDLQRLFDRIQIGAHVMDATAGRPDDRGEVLEALDEEGLGGGGVFLAAAVGHRLPAAGLLQWVLHRAAEPFEELQGGNAYFGEEGVDVAGDEEPDLHGHVPPMGRSTGEGCRPSGRGWSAMTAPGK